MSRRDLYAYVGKILRVDLNTGNFSFEPTAKYAREWLGGSGIAQWILYHELKASQRLHKILDSGSIYVTVGRRSRHDNERLRRYPIDNLSQTA